MAKSDKVYTTGTAVEYLFACGQCGSTDWVISEPADGHMKYDLACGNGHRKTVHKADFD